MHDQRYDTIGNGYTKHRCADNRIVSSIVDLLDIPSGSAIADVGAGTGNYAIALANRGYSVRAIEPSGLMRSKASPHENVQWFEGMAECIPLASDSVDGVVCILVAHHFSSLCEAVAEMDRICHEGKILWLTFDPRLVETPWFAEYFPEIWAEAFTTFLPLEKVMKYFVDLGRTIEAIPFRIPHDLQDFFIAAGWRRPEMYLDSEVRKCMSGFALSDQSTINNNLKRLTQELADGTWKKHHGVVLTEDTTDWGYRFILSNACGTEQSPTPELQGAGAPFVR